MKFVLAALVVLAASPACADLAKTNPISKVIQLLSELQAKLIRDGEAEEKAYKDFFEWCDDASREKQQEIKTLSGEKEELTATIQKATATIEELATKIPELGGKIATDEADLKAATEIRKKENENFVVVEAELVDGVDALSRAVKILEKHASLLQTKGAKDDQKFLDFEQAMNAIMDAASLSLHDKKKLQSLLQAGQKTNADADDMFGAMGAPAPDAYKGKSGGIVDVLQDMLEKAEDQLAEARKEEMTAKHEYDMLKQSITDALKFANADKEEAEKRKAGQEEEKAIAEGDLDVTSKDLADAQETYKNVGMECMTQAQAHDVSKQSRTEELKALATAKKILQTMTAGAQKQSYSFLETDSTVQAKSKTTSQGAQAVKVIKRLADNTHSAVLAQLAVRMEAAMRTVDSSSEDPFAKVKGMIRDMIEKLLKDAAAEASHKAWCDEEMAESKAKKEKLTGIVEDLTTKLDKATADIGRLTEEIAVLEEQLAALAKLQAEMGKMRGEENDAFKLAEADLVQGLDGVRMALKVLRDYYAQNAEFLQANRNTDVASLMQQPKPPAGHSKSSGAAGGIIGILEVAESDLVRNLAEIRADEETAQDEYDKTTQENKITKATKEQDVKYKSKEKASLEKFVAEATADRGGAQTELDAVLEYLEKVKDQCIAKPEPYEERKKRREAEIAGLKEALSILEAEAFVQVGESRRVLRGVTKKSL